MREAVQDDVLIVPGSTHDPASSKRQSTTDMWVISCPACDIWQPIKVWDAKDFPSSNNQQGKNGETCLEILYLITHKGELN